MFSDNVVQGTLRTKGRKPLALCACKGRKEGRDEGGVLPSQRIRQSVRRQQAKGFHTKVWKEAMSQFSYRDMAVVVRPTALQTTKAFFYTAQHIPVVWNDVRWGSHFKGP